MKRLILVLILFSFLPFQQALADCSNDSVVKNLISERNTKAKQLLKKWVRNTGNKDIASLAAEIWSNETFIQGICLNDPDFLKINLIFVNSKNNEVKVETIPVIILEWLMHDDFLSPYKQYPEKGTSNMENNNGKAQAVD